MSWTRITETGRGKLRARLAIDGWPYEFVSHASMAVTAADERERLLGLKLDVLQWEESSNPIDVIPQSGGMTFEIVDMDFAVTAALVTQPSNTCWLTEDLTATDVTMTVTTNAGFSVGDYVYIGSEVNKITSVSTAGEIECATDGSGDRKAFWGTTPTYHYSEDGADFRLVEITDKPRSMQGRVANLYVYGEGDDATSTATDAGNVIWSGIVSREPKLRGEGTTWTLQCDSMARALDQNMGEGLGTPFKPRGIYYNAACALEVEVSIFSSNTWYSSIAARYSVELNDDFFETQEEFCEYLQSALETELSADANPPTVRVVSDGPTGWHFEVQPNASSVRYVRVLADSVVDGETRGKLRDDAGSRVTTVSASNTYSVKWRRDDEPLRGVPRSFHTHFGALLATAGGDPKRLYIGGPPAALEDGSIIRVKLLNPQGEHTHRQMKVDTYSIGSGYVETSAMFLGGAGRFTSYDNSPELSISRKLAENADLADVMQAIDADYAVESPKGTNPHFLDGKHTTLATWTNVVNDVVRGRDYVANRDYFIGGEITLGDFLKNECRMMGLWLGFNNGKIVPIPIKTFVSTDPSVTSVAPLRSPRPSFELSSLGTLNGAEVKTGYKRFDDSWEGPTYLIRNVSTISRNPLGGTVKIEPRSTANASVSEATYQDLVELLEPLIGTYGEPYYIVQFGVPLASFSVNLGDGVSFSSDYLPNPTDGTRGVSNATGVVIGKNTDLTTGQINLTIQVQLNKYRGWAPALGIDANNVTHDGSNTYTVTVERGDPYGAETDWLPSPYNVSDVFTVGDRIEIYEWAVSAAIDEVGTIAAITDSTRQIQVNMDTSVGFSDAPHWCIRYNVASDSSLATTQKQFGYWAGFDRRIGFTTGEEAGKFAP